MNPIMRWRFTELGAAAMSAQLAYVAIALAVNVEPFEKSTIGAPIRMALNVASLFSVPLVLYSVFHSFTGRRWAWFLGCLFVWPVTLPYWWRHIRPDLTHAAQQRAPGDVPRPAGSGRA